VIKGKTELLKKNIYIYIYIENVDSKGGDVAKRNSKSMQFFFSEIESANKVQSFFQKEIPLVSVKHHFSYLSLH
jgi:hypothetical protein